MHPAQYLKRCAPPGRTLTKASTGAVRQVTDAPIANRAVRHSKAVRRGRAKRLRQVPATEKLSYTIDELRAVSGLGRTSIYKLIKTGRLKLIKIGRRSLIAGPSARRLLSDG
jgi:hypothetical protein